MINSLLELLKSESEDIRIRRELLLRYVGTMFGERFNRSFINVPGTLNLLGFDLNGFEARLARRGLVRKMTFNSEQGAFKWDLYVQREKMEGRAEMGKFLGVQCLEPCYDSTAHHYVTGYDSADNIFPASIIPRRPLQTRVDSS
jgi:hypothetical protein